MKSLGLAILLSLSFQALATDSVISAKMKFHFYDGSKAFSVLWDDAGQTGYIQMVLKWDRYSTKFKNGFNLRTANFHHFLSPLLTPKCAVRTVNGTLDGRQAGLGPIVITVQGSACKSFLKKFSMNPVQISFVHVSPFVGYQPPVDLNLEIVELP